MQQRKTRRIFATTFSFSFVVALCSLADSALAEITTKLTCASTAFEPYVIEKDQRIYGVDVEVVQAVGKRMGIDIEFVMIPWKRLEQEVKFGNATCVAAYFRTPEREEYMDFSNVPLHITAYTLFTHREKFPAMTFADIKGWSVGVNRGFKTTTDFEAAVYEKRILQVELNSTDQGFDMLHLNRLDAVLTNLHVGQYLTRVKYPGKFVPLQPSLSSTPAYFVFSKKANLSHMIPVFDEYLMQVMIDGTYKQIFDNYN
jgi:ABC-type amino acid transport substrate-binding protein